VRRNTARARARTCTLSLRNMCRCTSEPGGRCRDPAAGRSRRCRPHWSCKQARRGSRRGSQAPSPPRIPWGCRGRCSPGREGRPRSASRRDRLHCTGGTGCCCRRRRCPGSGSRSDPRRSPARWGTTRCTSAPGSRRTSGDRDRHSPNLGMGRRRIPAPRGRRRCTEGRCPSTAPRCPGSGSRPDPQRSPGPPDNLRCTSRTGSPSMEERQRTRTEHPLRSAGSAGHRDRTRRTVARSSRRMKEERRRTRTPFLRG
jgi:hypothetical protein